MSKLPDREPNPQEHAVEIVVAALDVLRTRDAVPLTDDQIRERARNTIAALLGSFEFMPRPIIDAVEAFRGAVQEVGAAVDGVRIMLRQAETHR